MMDKTRYSELVSQTAPKSKHLKTMVFAFLIGGVICCVGEGLLDATKAIFPSLEKDLQSGIVSIVMIFIGALLTGIGVYDDIGNVAGGGSIVPITGFANSIVSPAMEYKREGIILGICAKMFTIAGPIIVLGVFASFISGLLALLGL